MGERAKSDNEQHQLLRLGKEIVAPLGKREPCGSGSVSGNERRSMWRRNYRCHRCARDQCTKLLLKYTIDAAHSDA